MSSIHFVGGEKGGVGKSVFARLCCQWFIDHAFSFAALDADLSQAALLRSYPVHCHAVDLSSFASADQIMDRALGADRAVIVDLPAHSLEPLARWLDAGAVVDGAAEFGVELVFWHVTDGGFDSVRCLDKLLQLLGTSVRVNVVCNQGRSQDFAQLQGSESLRRALERGGRMLELPRLDPQIMYALDALACGIADALSPTKGPGGLTPMQRQRASKWLSHAYSQLGSTLSAATSAEPQPSPALSATTPELPDAPTLNTVEVNTTGEANDAVAPSDEASVTAAATFPKPPTSQLAVGTVISDGAATWTEVGDGCLIHHVRYR